MIHKRKIQASEFKRQLNRGASSCCYRWAGENRMKNCTQSPIRTRSFTELHISASWLSSTWMPPCTIKSVLSTIAKVCWTTDWMNRTKNWGAIFWNALKPERSSCHPEGPSQHHPMFKTNDPRFWKAVTGIISLVLSCSLAWLILELWISLLITIRFRIDRMNQPRF